PGTAAGDGPVLTTERSASPFNWSVSVSATCEVPPTPGGLAAVAVLLTTPRASAAIVAVSRKVALVPAGRFTVVSRAPDPLPAAQVAPPLPLHVQVKPLSSGVTGSVTRTPVTALGPVLPTVMV